MPPLAVLALTLQVFRVASDVNMFFYPNLYLMPFKTVFSTQGGGVSALPSLTTNVSWSNQTV